MTWLYNAKAFGGPSTDQYGFIYQITHKPSEKSYIGKKLFWSKRTLPPLKGKKRRRIKIIESDWMSYWGSSKYLNEDLEEHGKHNFTREIISIHPNKRETNYAELCELVTRDVLHAVNAIDERLYYNENIERVFYHSKDCAEHRRDAHTKRIECEYLRLL